MLQKLAFFIEGAVCFEAAFRPFLALEMAMD